MCSGERVELRKKHSLRGFYKTAGVVKVFVFAVVLGSCFEDSSRASIRTRCEPLWARCLMGPDGDESGLLSTDVRHAGSQAHVLFRRPIHARSFTHSSTAPLAGVRHH